MLAHIHQFCECIGYGYSLSPANAKRTLGKLQQFLKTDPSREIMTHESNHIISLPVSICTMLPQF